MVDVICDRIVVNSHMVKIEGDSMRKNCDCRVSIRILHGGCTICAGRYAPF